MRKINLVCGFLAFVLAACDSSNKPAPALSGESGPKSGPGDGAKAAAANMSFFVSSDKSKTGNLGGLLGADARCTALAKAAGSTKKTWHAYLSVEHGDGGGPVNARDRIGNGPWYNSKGVLLAKDLAALHARSGDADVFVDEHGNKINGQWAGSPLPLEHDILTGSNQDGTVVVSMTCADWTPTDMAVAAIVGHSDGLGPGQSDAGRYPSWNSSHPNGGCNDTGPRGGAGRIYCFAVE
jgi:hypothetical protein